MRSPLRVAMAMAVASVPEEEAKAEGRRWWAERAGRAAPSGHVTSRRWMGDACYVVENAAAPGAMPLDRHDRVHEDADAVAMELQQRHPSRRDAEW